MPPPTFLCSNFSYTADSSPSAEAYLRYQPLSATIGFGHSDLWRDREQETSRQQYERPTSTFGINILMLWYDWGIGDNNRNQSGRCEHQKPDVGPERAGLASI